MSALLRGLTLPISSRTMSCPQALALRRVNYTKTAALKSSAYLPAEGSPKGRLRGVLLPSVYRAEASLNRLAASAARWAIFTRSFPHSPAIRWRISRTTSINAVSDMFHLHFRFVFLALPPLSSIGLVCRYSCVRSCTTRQIADERRFKVNL